MRRDVLVAVAVFALALWQNLAQVPDTPFNPDESRWLHRAHYLRDVVHPFGPTWKPGYLTRGQPPLGSYATGIGLLAQGRDLATNGSWIYTCQEGVCRTGFQERAENVAAGNVPPAADLQAGRRTSAVVGALTALVVYLLGARLTNRTGGVAGALLLAVHPFQSYVSSLATADALLGLLLALAGLATARLAARPTGGRALLVGVLLGLGGATKLSPLLTAVPLAGLGAALLAPAIWSRVRGGGWTTSPRRDPLAVGLIAAPLVAFLVFIAVYPYLWPDPVGRTADLFTFRAQEMRAQGKDWPVLAVPTRADALRRIGVTLGGESDATSRVAGAVLRRVGLSPDVPPLDLPLAIAGAEVLVALAVSRGVRSPQMLVVVLLGAQAAITVAGMRSGFDRYLVPIALFVAVSGGVLIGQMAVGVMKTGREAMAALASLPTRWARRGSPGGHPAALDRGVP